MSHIPQRKEKDCLNCGTVVQGRYCQNCGQENVVTKETFWHMVTHFFYDITHFDSSFFSTIRYLLSKPGYLSTEYSKGKRASYLHPVRLYVFTSAVYFLLFFSFFKPGNANENARPEPLSVKERNDYSIKLKEQLKNDTGNLDFKKALALIKDSSRVFTVKDKVKPVSDKGVSINFTDKDYKSIAEYDSAELKLPPSKRDGWIVRKFVKLGISLSNKYKENPEQIGEKLLEGFFHRLPYLLFVSLPLFALILKLVYIRRKEYYFADHGVFTIHHYVLSFILLLLAFSLNKLQDITGWNYLNSVNLFLFLGLSWYLLVGMHNFYKQGWGKTIIKFLIVTLLSLTMMLLLFLIFLLFSAFTI